MSDDCYEGVSMNIVQIRNIKLGEGLPKICIPIVGITKDEIIQEAKVAVDISTDIVEWRADCFKDVLEFEQVQEVLEGMRAVVVDIPILFTFRTAGEGGEKHHAHFGRARMRRNNGQKFAVENYRRRVQCGRKPNRRGDGQNRHRR